LRSALFAWTNCIAEVQAVTTETAKTTVAYTGRCARKVMQQSGWMAQGGAPGGIKRCVAERRYAATAGKTSGCSDDMAAAKPDVATVLRR